MNKQLKNFQQQVTELVERLKTTETELALYKEKYEQSTKAYSQLLEAFKQIQRRQFGVRSERFIDNFPGQIDMFSDVAPWMPEENLTSKDDTDKNLNDEIHLKTIPKKPRKKKDHNHFAKNLPRREVIVPAEKLAENSKVVRYEITELLDYVPPVYEVVVQKREVLLTCDKETNISTITIAPNPKRILPKAQVTESFLAHMIVSKLYDRQPCII